MYFDEMQSLGRECDLQTELSDGLRGNNGHELIMRLLSLLLIQIFVALALPYVGGSSAEFQSGIGTYNKHTIIGGPPLVKTYQVISRCSERSVQMLSKKKINAKGRRRDGSTHLNFVSSHTGAIRIRSDAFKTYLCFNRKGRLISRPSGGNPQCMFREKIHKNYLKLQSVANPEWYVGFNKNGHKLKGYAEKETWAKEKCFMFTKVEWRPGSKVRHQAKFQKFNIDSDSVILTEFGLSNR